MSRSKRDILDTEKMLERLAALLREKGGGDPTAPGPYRCRGDAEALRRISMTLHAWHELECGDGNDHVSWCITRGHKVSNMEGGRRFEHDDNGKPYLERHFHKGNAKPTYSAMPDREAGALNRLKKIMARYPALQAYVQGDPRGCALYILKPGDVPDGGKADAYYNRGLAVHK